MVECSAQLRRRVGHLSRPFLVCRFSVLKKGLGTRLVLALILTCRSVCGILERQLLTCHSQSHSIIAETKIVDHLLNCMPAIEFEDVDIFAL